MLCLAAACGKGDGRPPAFETTDSAGVTVAWSSAPAWAAGQAWTVGGVVTSTDGAGLDVFRVAAAVRRPDGGLVIADEGTSLIHFLDPAGVVEASVGGAGDGPGEYRILQAVGAAGGDTVWAYDFSHRRISLYHGPADVVRSFPLRPPLNAAAAVGWWGGSFVFTQLWGDEEGPLSPGLSRSPVAFVRYDAAGGLRDTLGLFPGREVLLRPEGGRMTMGVAPFTRTAAYALGAERLFIGDQVAHEIRAYDQAGGLLGITRWAGPSLLVTAAEVAEWKERQVGSAPAVDRPSVRSYLAGTPIPEHRPAFGRILSGPGGYLWVGAYEHFSESATGWEVFAPDGRWLGEVRMPRDFSLLQVGDDWVVGVARNEFDVERVEMRALLRPGDPGP